MSKQAIKLKFICFKTLQCTNKTNKLLSMSCGIYIITNTITGKQYVGQSINIEKRIKQHRYRTSKGNSYIDNTIQKHGWDNFTWNILYECEPENLNIEEQKFIALYNTYHNGYNLTRGGEFSSLGNPMHNPRLKQKAINSKKGFKHSKTTKQTLSKKNNSTGFYHVIKENCPKCKQGFIYRYEMRKQNIRIRASDIYKLEKKVKEKGYEWFIINQELAEKTILESESKRIKTEKEHPTGYYGVIKRIDDSYTNGYYYRYRGHDSQGKTVYIQATTILKLKNKVLARGLDWIKFEDNDNHGDNMSTLDFWL